MFAALVESFCSEQNARMTAMDTASDSAKEMLSSLSLEFNRRARRHHPRDYRDCWRRRALTQS